MNTYKVTYNGNSTRFKNFQIEINANSDREAIEEIYSQYLDDKYFPQEDGSIKDSDGDIIANVDDNTIEYDGGYFSAEMIN